MVSHHPRASILTKPWVSDVILRALDRRLQEDWTRDAREGPRVLMSLMIDFEPMG